MGEYFNMFWEKWSKMEQELPINTSKKTPANIITYFNNNKKLLIILFSAFLILILSFFLFLEFQKKRELRYQTNLTDL